MNAELAVHLGLALETRDEAGTRLKELLAAPRTENRVPPDWREELAKAAETYAHEQRVINHIIAGRAVA